MPLAARTWKSTQLATAKLQLVDAEANYDKALAVTGVAEATTEALWREAHTLGFVPAEAPPDCDAMLEALAAAVTSPSELQPGDTGYEQRMAHLRRECDRLRDSLRALAADRQTLISEGAAADEFATSARIPQDRLASLNLLPRRRQTAGAPLRGHLI
ncbi:hypothetical protein OHU34_42870 [Streptomyces sp. NBC_00080]|uniref:hypothetical protein n=1 Tax=Streptomyces sp. NBC_00080 TaxID=2975645 RepID=UPI0032525C15